MTIHVYVLSTLYKYVLLSIIIYKYVLLSIIIYKYVLLSIIIYKYVLLSIIIYKYVLLSIIIYKYVLLSIIIYKYVLLSIITALLHLCETWKFGHICIYLLCLKDWGIHGVVTNSWAATAVFFTQTLSYPINRN